MRRIGVGIVLLWSAILWADDAAFIAAIESKALTDASSYAKDIRQIGKSLLAPEKSAQLAQFTKEISLIKQDESLATHLKKVSSVLVFLSFSMPEKSLNNWLLQCRQSGATPVIRGLVHNSFKDTMQAVLALSQKTGIGLQLDPILFKTFGVLEVPAVVYVKDTPACPANMNCKPVDYDSLYGDVSLDYALDKMRSDERTSDKLLNDMIHRLRGGMA